MHLLKTVLRRIANLLVALFVVATVTFFLMKLIPGNPFQQEQMIPEEVLKAIYRHYGFDKPLFIQYLTYLKKLVTFSLGPSFHHEGLTVNQIIRDGFPISLLLGVFSLCISIFFGLLFGTISAFYRGKWQDRTFMLIAVLGISTPSFVLATGLQYWFSVHWNLLPIARWGTFAHMILPALSLAALPTAFIARLVRSNMIEVLEQDYIWMARAKGLNSTQIILRHVLKNSLLPVITYIGHILASVLTGSFVIEKIFAIPGLGSSFVSCIMNRDYTLIMGITMFYSAVLMASIWLVDMVYLLIDPRIRKAYRENYG